MHLHSPFVFVHKVSAVDMIPFLAPPTIHVLLVGKEHFAAHVLKVTNKTLSETTVYQKLNPAKPMDLLFTSLLMLWDIPYYLY